jgi:hypothetical protein
MRIRASVAVAAALAAALAWAEDPPGEERHLSGNRITQDGIDAGDFALREIQLHGLRIFATPFSKLDGYGDGPLDPQDTRKPGGRPTLGGNGTLLRTNGLDAQTCLECHSIVSNAAMPAVLGVGGVGGSNSNAIIQPTGIDVGDGDTDGTAGFDGRFANPPFLFGSGAVELLAKEMTTDLQQLRTQAIASPGTPVALVTKGVSFGTIVADGQGVVDTSAVEGVQPDLVVRPFGRKGEFATIRAFDKEAVQFHFGMQPTEVVGAGVDADGDGVLDEILAGELSALSIFAATLERPFQERVRKSAKAGEERFHTAGCADCHLPALETVSRELTFSFPEVETDPSANVYFSVNLARAPTRFRRNAQGGITVPLYADLKRHDMGPGLAETFSAASAEENRMFTTARLWGIADTAPYLHDGRATTLTEAILAHGGEAQDARDAFDALPPTAKAELLAFLRTLRTPRSPARRLQRVARRRF